MDELARIWKRQAEFNRNFNPNLGSLSQSEQEALTKDFVLYIQDELMDLLKNLSWKMHRRERASLVHANIREEIIDIFKYWNGLALIWNINEKEFITEWERKTEVVEQKYLQEFSNPWDATKYCGCAVVDIDGVLADYIKGIFEFILERTGVEIPPLLNGQEFYAHVGRFIGHERAYELKHQFRETGTESQGLDAIPGALEFMTALKADGYYILLMTARPYKKYKRIMADTICWLRRFGFPYHSIIFDENKEDRIIKDYTFAKFVVEDTLENALKIASKGIQVYLRETTYNQGDTRGLPVTRFKDFKELLGGSNEQGIIREAHRGPEEKVFRHEGRP
jgi:hypothetical protein